MNLEQRVAAFRRDLQNPLYRNAYALMLSTALTAPLGLAYWVLAARLYDVDAVGAGAGLITAMMLISTFTQLNFMQVLIRFVPRAGRSTQRLMTNAYAIAGSLALIVASITVGVVQLIASPDHVLDLGFAASVWFVVATVAWSIFCLQDAALTGLRKTAWIPVENGVFGVVKLIALVAFLVIGDANGIFLSWTVPTLVAALVINHFIFRRFVPLHATVTAEREQRIEPRQIVRFIAGDYIGNVSAQLSMILVPLLVIAVLDETANGYFYIAQTMATALDLVAINLAASLTVEGAHDEERIGALTAATLRRTLVIVVPTALCVVIAAPIVLGIFGSAYAEESAGVLRLLALASILKAMTSVFSSLCRVLHRTRLSGLVQLVQAALLIIGSLLLMPEMGIEGVGVAALASQAIVTIYVVPTLIATIRKTSNRSNSRHDVIEALR